MFPSQYKLNLTSDTIKSFSIVLSNDQGEQVQIGYNKEENAYYIDRTKSGKIDFEKGFAKRFSGPSID
ncbi:MAG: GH32 C-terminal domain-containing protein [Segetibacter sp.]